MKASLLIETVGSVNAVPRLHELGNRNSLVRNGGGRYEQQFSWSIRPRVLHLRLQLACDYFVAETGESLPARGTPRHSGTQNKFPRPCTLSVPCRTRASSSRCAEPPRHLAVPRHPAVIRACISALTSMLLYADAQVVKLGRLTVSSIPSRFQIFLSHVSVLNCTRSRGLRSMK